MVRAFDGIKAAVCDVAGPNVARMVSAGSNGGYGPWVGKQWDTPKVVTEGRVHYECTNSIGWAKSATASAFMQGNIPTYFELRAANEAPNQDGCESSVALQPTIFHVGSPTCYPVRTLTSADA